MAEPECDLPEVACRAKHVEAAGILCRQRHRRHSFGAHLRLAGVSLADIADLMGHRDLATTQIYAKVAQEHLRVAAGKLAPLIEATSRVALPAKFDVGQSQLVPLTRALLNR